MARAYQAMSLAAIGERVTGDAELEQALGIILGTRLGAIPGDPGFGIELDEIVDAPTNEVPALLVREVTRAVAASDPRILVRGVKPEPRSVDGKLHVSVVWRPAGAEAGEDRVTRVKVADAS